MGAADMLEDGFPHGTREGYDQGCRGSHCPAVADGYLSCAQARTRYQSDYAYKKRVDAGLSLAQLAEADEREAAEQRAKLEAARARRVASAPEPEAEAAAEPEPAVDEHDDTIPADRHGTTKGYYAGCRLKELCPGVESVGQSCTQAVNEYQREIKRKRREAQSVDIVPVAKAPEPAIEPDADPEPESPEVVTLRQELAKEIARANEAEELVIQWADKFEDRQKRVAVLTDRVASLELELDVAKAANTTAAAVERRASFAEPVPVERSTPSRFRFARDEHGGVVVDVEGQQPGFVRFEVDEAGALVGVAVQSGKAS